MEIEPRNPDLFVDSNLSGHFARPIRRDYVDLIDWLFYKGHLVVCSSLIREYNAAVRGSTAHTTLVVIVDRLLREGRLNRMSKEELAGLTFPKKVERRLRSNRADHDFIKLVLLSDRKLGLSEDRNLAYDINSFPGFDAQVADSPSKIEYRE